MIGSLELYGDVFAELNRLQQSLDHAFRPAGNSNIRAMSRRAFPLVNVGSTADALEVLALAPGVNPAELQITVDKGVLVIAGERKDQAPAGQESTAVYAQERFQGSFRRVISLPEDADPAQIHANYRDGLLRITVGRKEASKPRQIVVN